MKYIEIPKDFYSDVEYKIKLPTFFCSCGEEVLDTPFHREQSLNYMKNLSIK